MNVELLKPKRHQLNYLFFIVIFVAWGSISFAQEPKDSSVGHVETIKKATNLALQHDRVQASQVLLNAISRLDKSEEGTANGQDQKAAQAELLSALDKISRLFFQDETQQLHEVAQSIRFQNSGLALTRLDEALRIEPDNLSLLLMRARILLADRKCKAAAAELEKATQINPRSSEVILLLAQGSYCDGNAVEFFTRTAFLVDQMSGNLFWQLLRARAFILMDAYGNALDSTEASIAIDKNYPEPYYILSRLLQEESSLSGEEKLRIVGAYDPNTTYLNMCSALSSRARRKYAGDPWLCHASHIETVKNNEEVELPNIEN